MISQQQADTATIFHAEHDADAKRIERWRRNGKTQRWKTRPGEFRIPVKFGLRDYADITHADRVHATDDCPSEKFRGA